jgi:biotin transport system substrate-specific component
MAMNYSYLINETAKDRSWIKEAAVILGASIIIALFAPISIPLPFSPIPIAVQAHVVLLLSCLLGSKRSVMSVLTYLFQGAIGLPVFAGGIGGIAVLAGPRGGYLLGYLVAAFVTGFMIERTMNRTPSKVFAAMGFGNLIVYLFGISWLSRYIGWGSAFVLGMLPFLIGDLLKLIAATKCLKKLRFFTT